MGVIKKEEYRDLLNKYKTKIAEELDTKLEDKISPKIQTKDYQDFRKEILPLHISLYEKACNFSEKALKIKPDAKRIPIISEAIQSAHLKVTPSGVSSFSILAPLILIVFGSIMAFAVLQSMLFVIIVLILGTVLIKPLADLPLYVANFRRLKASNQMVCVFFKFWIFF